jgi:hypothetical protein
VEKKGAAMAGDLPEASRSGHCAPARRVVDGFGEVAIRRRRRAVLFGFSELNYDRRISSFCLFLSVPRRFI